MDPNTVVIILAVHLISTGALLLLVVRKTSGLDGARHWGWGTTTFGAAYLGRLAAGGLLRPLNPVTIVLDCMMVIAALMFIAGLRRFVGERVHRRVYVAAFGLHVLLECVAASIWGIVGRLGTLNFSLGVLDVLLAWFALRAVSGQPREARPPLWVLSVLMFGLGALTGARVLLIMVTGSVDAAYQGLQSQIFYGYGSFTALLLAMTLLWMVFVRLNGRLAELATRDPLSQALNRNGLAQALQQHFSARSARPLILMILDIDHFKRVNDQHGHAAGDRLIEALARTLQKNLRRGDFLARIGGEEFLIGYVGDGEPDPVGATLAAERLRTSVQSMSLSLPTPGATLSCTVSIGVSRPVSTLAATDAAQREADEALYRAKTSGRNRVESATGPH